MNRQGMLFGIGIVTIVAIFLLATMIVWFGEVHTALQPHQRYFITFTNALGAAPKAPVRRAGLRIGEITKVEYSDDDALVIVTVDLEGDNYFREGDIPRLRQSSLIGGDVFLDVETAPAFRGKKNRTIIPPGRTLEGKPPLDLSPSAEAANSLVPNANTTLDEVQKTSKQWTELGERANRVIAKNEEEINRILQQTRESSERLNTALDSLNNTLDKRMQKNVQDTAQNLADTSRNLQPLIEDSRLAIQQIRSTTARLDEVANNLQAATRPLAQRSESTIKNLDETTANLNVMTADLSVMLRRFQNSNGSLKRFIEDPKLYQHLDDAATKLDRTLVEFAVILQDLQVFSDKIARHPGELGVQGVLTRDQGTKNVPPSQLQQYRR